MAAPFQRSSDLKIRQRLLEVADPHRTNIQHAILHLSVARALHHFRRIA